MTHPYFFIITAEPTPAAFNARDLEGAHVNVWIMETDIATAEVKARSHVLSYGWIPRKIRFAGEATDELIASLDEIEQRNYEEAIQSGIAAAFYGWTKARHPAAFFEYRPLGPPLDAGKEKMH